jgi:hypothetical protein
MTDRGKVEIIGGTDLTCENLLVRGLFQLLGQLAISGVADNSLLRQAAGVITGADLSDDGTQIRIGDVRNQINIGNLATSIISIGALLSPTSPINFGGLLQVAGVVNEDGWTKQSLPANNDVTNLQDQNSDFLLAVTAGQTYALDALLQFAANNAANDAEFRFHVDAGTLSLVGEAAGISAAFAAAFTIIQAGGVADTNQTPVGCGGSLTSPTPVRVCASFVPSATTTFRLQFGNNVTGAGITSRLMAGSWWKTKRLL